MPKVMMAIEAPSGKGSWQIVSEEALRANAQAGAVTPPT